MTLKEYIQLERSKGRDISYGTIAKDVPCHSSYIQKIADGKKIPTYAMARRIEIATNGAVSRYNWHPKE